MMCELNMQHRPYPATWLQLTDTAKPLAPAPPGQRTEPCLPTTPHQPRWTWGECKAPGQAQLFQGHRARPGGEDLEAASSGPGIVQLYPDGPRREARGRGLQMGRSRRGASAPVFALSLCPPGGRGPRGFPLGLNPSVCKMG